MEGQPAKRRRLNFSEEEIFVIVTEVAQRRDIVLSRLDTALTKQAKKNAWDVINQAVNAVSATVRTSEEARKKFMDSHSLVKTKLAAIRRNSKKTGKPVTVRHKTI